MGLIYSSSDSEKLMQALSKNLASSKEVISQLKGGSQKIIRAVDGRTLSGTAYTAGKGLFTDIILPLIAKVTSACDTLEQELHKYKIADSMVSSEGFLDEDNLQEQIETKKDLQKSIDRTAMIMNIMMKTSIIATLSDTASEHIRELNQMSDSLQQDIYELQRKIERLYEFDAQTKGLFKNSLDEMKLAMQGVLVLNNTTVNSDGTYQLPAGVDKSWFTELKSEEQQQEMEVNEKKIAIKELNELFEKNPVMAIEKIKNNDRLFGYVIGALDKFPEGIQNAALGIFIAQESWNKLPKDVATKVLNSSKFASYLSNAPLPTQAIAYKGLIKLNEKGWSVLAPIGYATKILSKTSEGAKLIAGSKVGLDLFKKLKPVSEFVKAHPVAKESIGYTGDGLSVIAYAYDEFTNPESPAYGDESKAVYGGINLFFWNAGPLEGAQYGGPFGAVAGTMNTIIKGVDITTPKVNVDTPLGRIDISSHSFYFGLSGNSEKREKNKQKWLKKLYEQYGKQDGITTDKKYEVGVQPHSGSPNFNPNS
ncbi:T7SS effector LXG polymorphic toxin [Listeria marthii]|uniref:T7SS effector LXG polymorphic toxin n=1 Tax=Listeria marthii TaxID=529731 RepID=UPI00396F7300